MSDKLIQPDVATDHDLSHTLPSAAAAPGRSTVSSKHSSARPIVLRVESAEAAQVFADRMFGARDDNGVAANADQFIDRAAGSSGSPLPSALRERLESSLGADLSSVRIHDGRDSADAAKAVGAKAYTVGQDIHFGAGHYDPATEAGQFLLAHEVAHTVQQAGATPSRQHKLEVSTPQDGAELEADRAAEAMVAGRPAAVSAAFGVSRMIIQRDDVKFEDEHIDSKHGSMAAPMGREADAEEKAAHAKGKLHVDTPIAGVLKLESLSSVETVAQARDCISKVVKANANLYQRRATQKGKVDDLSGANEWREREAAEKDVKQTDGFLSRNEGVISSLQHIVDLGEGNSQLDEKGNRPGHDMRAMVFAQLAQKAFTDFARLQGTVNAFVAVHPQNDRAGADGGQELGTAVATEGKSNDPKALDKVKEDVQAAQKADPILNNMIVEYKGAYEKLAGGEFDQQINTQMEKCASAVSKGKNIQLNIDLGTSRPDTPEQASAKAEADKVNKELNDAKAALNQGVEIAKLALSVMGMPAVGIALPELPAGVTKTIGVARKIDAGQSKFTGIQVEKQVSDSIVTAVAKMLTDYDTKMNKAKGSADQANANAKRNVVKLDTSNAAVAKGDIIAEFQALAKQCAEVEKQKATLRDKSKAISDYQTEQRIKKGGKAGPDIGGITKALAEVAAYTTQAKAAILQGEEEQKIAREMSAEREKVAGGMSQTRGAAAQPDLAGDRELASAKKDNAYVDCEATAPFLLSEHPLSFRIRSEVLDRGSPGASTDKAAKHVEVANMGVAAALQELKENLETAAGFEAALKAAMGF
jgi:hypothetical protein